MPGMSASELDKFVTIERPIADEAFDGAGSGAWQRVDDVWAGVRDMLPSRGERLAEGINIATRPARVRMYLRDDVTPEMRFVLGTRVMQITAGPAQLGDDGMEFMVEDYRPAGNPA